jgi:RNA polymerase sigma-70 factor (ECF subfamily)
VRADIAFLGDHLHHQWPLEVQTNRVAIPISSTKSGAGPTDAALVVAARADEPWAKEALFRRYVAMVNGLGYRLLGRDADLEDLVQDSFMEAWRSLAKLEQPQAFGSWLGSIVIRTAHKTIRRRRIANRLGLRRSEPIDVDALIAPTAPPDIRSELRSIYRLVERLPTSTRTAFILRRVEGLPLEDIAQALGTSLATVKRRIADAEQRLSHETSSQWGES